MTWANVASKTEFWQGSGSWGTGLSPFSSADEATVLAHLEDLYENSTNARTALDAAVATQNLRIGQAAPGDLAFARPSDNVVAYSLTDISNFYYFNDSRALVNEVAPLTLIHEIIHVGLEIGDLPSISEAYLNGATSDHQGDTVAEQNIISQQMEYTDNYQVSYLSSLLSSDPRFGVLETNSSYTDENPVDIVRFGDSPVGDPFADDLDHSSRSAQFRDLMFGFDENDTITAGDGDDYVYGGADHDDLFGGDGDDVLHGGNGPTDDDPADDGADYIEGGEGNDHLFGSYGPDYLVSTGGEDILDGGQGNDVLDRNNNFDGGVTYVFRSGSGHDVLNPIEFSGEIFYDAPWAEDVITFEGFDVGDATLVWDYELEIEDAFEPYPDDPGGSYGYVDYYGGDAALAFNGDSDSILLGWLSFQDWAAFPDLTAFGATLEFADLTIDTPQEFIEQFDLGSIAASAIPASFTSALDDFESARGGAPLRVAGGAGLGDDTGAGGDVLALGDVLSGFGPGNEAELAQLLDDGPEPPVVVAADGSAGGASFTPIATASGVTGADLDGLINQGNVEVA